jgi:threonine/homoserine/homoserine lactone efflux protein
MPTSSILAFWAVAGLLIVVPGADWAFTIASGLRGGRSVLSAVSGLVIGYAVLTVVVAGGMGALVVESPAILTGLTIVGGAYLAWHGARTFAHPSTPAAAGEPPTGSSRSTLWRGVGVSGLNPKGLLIFLALLPQFTNQHSSWPVADQIGVLGLVFTANVAVFYACLGTFARSILATRPAAARTISRFSAATMVAIGLALVAERLIST